MMITHYKYKKKRHYKDKEAVSPQGMINMISPEISVSYNDVKKVNSFSTWYHENVSSTTSYSG